MARLTLFPAGINFSEESSFYKKNAFNLHKHFAIFNEKYIKSYFLYAEKIDESSVFLVNNKREHFYDSEAQV